jgi:hypothetical protein
MDWGEMEALFAAAYVDEIATAQRRAGKALLHETLASLSTGERGALRRGAARTVPVHVGRCRELIEFRVSANTATTPLSADT